MNILWLIFTHHLADVALQPSWLIERKKHYWWSHYEHAMIWTGAIAFVLAQLDLLALWKIPFLVVVHFVVDYFRYVVFGKRWWYSRWERRLLYIDQAIHYGQLLVVGLL